MDALKKLIAKRPEKAGWTRRGDEATRKEQAYLAEQEAAKAAAAKKAQEEKAAMEAYLQQKQAKVEKLASVNRQATGQSYIQGAVGRGVTQLQKSREEHDKRLDLLPDGDENDSDLEAPMEYDDVIDRLRELGEPIQLFGENDMKRFKRLRAIETLGKENPDAVQPSPSPGPSPGPEEEDEGDEPDLEPLEEEGEAQSPKAKAILKWVRGMLHSWEEDLQAMSADEKKKALGKAELLQYRQSRQYLKPLLKALKGAGSLVLSDLMVDRLNEIVELCDQKQYAKAGDVYMALAIGNMPFPQGATAAQIQAAKAETARLQTDDTTRKFVQTVKRLISQCEKRFPA